MTDEIKPEAPIDPAIANDPEVLAEAKKTRIWHLKLERYKEMANAISVILQTFKAEAISLVSGIGTLVVGWFQVKKWVIQGRHEVRTELKATARSTEQVYGAGASRPRHSPTLSQETAAIGRELKPEMTAIADPMNYVPAVTLLVFIWASIKAWSKRKKKLEEKGVL